MDNEEEEAKTFELNSLLERWKIYFPQELRPTMFNKNDFKHLSVKVFYEAFSSADFDKYIEWDNEDNNQEKIVGYINYTSLQDCKDNNIIQLLDYIYENPTDVITSLAVALDAVRFYTKHIPKRKEVIPRFINYNKIFPLSTIKSHCISKFICVKGTILRISSIKVLVKNIVFNCNDCKAKIQIHLCDGKWQTPNKCINMECRSRFFIPDKHSSKTSFYQRVRLQEIENDIKDLNAGKMPKCIDVEIRDDLIDKCISGDVVTICGTLKTEIQSDNKGYGKGGNINKNTGLYSSFIDANSIMNNNINCMNSGSYESVDQHDITNFLQLAERNDLFPLFVKSACPSIYGNELVKAGLVLSLFGGTDLRFKKQQQYLDLMHSNEHIAPEDEEDEMEDLNLAMRPDIHILMIGDPGMGKSQMLKHVNCISPRGVYVCGNSTTNAGLTATLIRDASTNEQNLEAGALVLSDLGVCCIDEFDKMSGDQSALLEAMEQQTISIAKGGIIGSLSARCTLMACANPATGHYQRSRSILDNIRISNAILSRFDLIFLMLDDPDINKDKLLSEHIMKLHAKRGKKTHGELSTYGSSQTSNYGYGSESGYGTNSYDDPQYAKRSRYNNINGSQAYGMSDTDMDRGHVDDDYEPLAFQLKREMARLGEEVLSPDFIKKYVIYARRSCFPKLSKEACEVLKEFYISLRENSNGHNSIPITSRQLDSIIRLSQARAKLDLRSIVTQDDAQEIVKLIQESLFEACYQEVGFKATLDKIAGKKKVDSGLVDTNNIGSLSGPKQTKIFIERLKEKAADKGDKIFTFNDLINISRSLNMQVGDFRMYIDKLNAQNHLLMKSSKIYELNA